ncbi:VOC family protein [Spirosoma linguale]|uniref:Glyoxalase/bleomycin resistance protein/dioxygenase n=1 Tax=Spirosoma linguale (strain ATCC 33905 / DSM 74 / LMG 10896 / Claus 1) TaxID=504472 RepID=D2QDB5_SPILD|nr:Glyoxalase/bleomycin resistance protein/dioxygenase [Spirosoma linguale DSM 74]
MKKLAVVLLIALGVATSGFVSGQDKLGITRHNHISIHVKDVPTSAAFYRDVLGLKPIPVPENLKAIRAWFDLGNGQQIHLLDGRTEQIVHDKNGSHYALFVEDINKSEQYLKAKNIPYHRQVRFDGIVQVYFSDLDGYLFELNEDKNKKSMTTN